MSASRTLDFRPRQVDIVVSAGDSVSFQVRVDQIAAFPNPVWKAQARTSQGDTVQDFQCVPTADGVAVALSATQTRELFNDYACQSTQQVVGSRPWQLVWRGSYDLQVEHDPDVVRTLVRGTLTIESDVTA